MKNRFLSLVLVLTGLFLSVGLISCKEDEMPLGTPYVDAPLRAMKMEMVSVAYRNIEKDVEVIVDFGDGSTPVTVTGPVAATHKYEYASNNQPDGSYHIKVTAKGQTIEKRILVYPLRALSDLVAEMTTPGYDKVLVMAHRANTTNKSIPENSIAAVEACIAAGVDFIETDTHITADGHVVICHDQTITRTTNGTGDITKMTLEQIKSYRLKDRNGNVTDMTMPTLEEFLKAARGKIYVNLDYSPRTASTADVMEVVARLDMMGQVLFYCNSATKVSEVLAIDATAQAYPWYSNYTALPGPGYFVQSSYVPGSAAANVSAAVKAGMICTVNMLNDVPDNSVSETHLNALFSQYPDVHVIQSDVSDKLIPVLTSKGLR